MLNMMLNLSLPQFQPIPNNYGLQKLKSPDYRGFFMGAIARQYYNLTGLLTRHGHTLNQNRTGLF